MKACRVVEIVTPKKVLLNGLWFGSATPTTAIVWVHGLGSSAFSKLSMVEDLARKDVAVLTFNNRGHDIVSSFSTVTGKTRRKGGAAHEIFEECVDDLEGAIEFARLQGAKNIFLAGHSTGCQKAIYWAHKKGNGVRGIILLAPISDYAASIKLYGKTKVARAANAAQAMVAAGKPHVLVAKDLSPEGAVDAQRFISLNTPDSVEQSIFSYFDDSTNPKVLKSIKIPILAFLADKDEYADRPAQKIVDWLSKQLTRCDTVVVPGVDHAFRGGEVQICSKIRHFLTI
jgi:alpha-beta hydrolase superfamily lysophospholipase